MNAYDVLVTFVGYFYLSGALLSWQVYGDVSNTRGRMWTSATWFLLPFFVAIGSYRRADEEDDS